AFILVAGPDEQVLDQIEYLLGQMAARRMPLKGVVMNRVHSSTVQGVAELDDRTVLVRTVERWLAASGAQPGNDSHRTEPRALARSTEGRDGAPRSLPERLVDSFVDQEKRARGDALRIEVFRQGLPRGVPVVIVPNLATDIHDLRGLLALEPYLTARSRV